MPREDVRKNESSCQAAGRVDRVEFEYVLSPDAKVAEQVDFLDRLNGLSLTGAELAGMAHVIRSRCVRVIDVPENAMDLCGTGGDRSGTFNVSTIASFVVAGAGIAVAKHGNRAVSSKCGSADCLEQLGISTSLQPNDAARMIRDVGIAFMFAPLFHPTLARVSAARKTLAARGEKSVFNILGPLVNPAFITRQAVGVFRKDLITPVAEALQILGVRSAMVFHGQGLDEVTLTGETQHGRLRDGTITYGRLTPEELGFRRCAVDDISGGNATENAQLCRGILEGHVKGARRDMVVLNAAVAILVGSTKDVELRGCVDLAADSIDSGRALNKLTEVARYSGP